MLSDKDSLWLVPPHTRMGISQPHWSWPQQILCLPQCHPDFLPFPHFIQLSNHILTILCHRLCISLMPESVLIKNGTVECGIERKTLVWSSCSAMKHRAHSSQGCYFFSSKPWMRMEVGTKTVRAVICLHWCVSCLCPRSPAVQMGGGSILPSRGCWTLRKQDLETWS